MVFDRGSIKWASLMLPEHVKALREWQDGEKHPRARMPLFDDQLNETFDRILQQAYVDHRPLSVTFIENGREQTAKGIVTKLDPINETLTLRGLEGQKREIPIRDITHVS